MKLKRRSLFYSFSSTAVDLLIERAQLFLLKNTHMSVSVFNKIEKAKPFLPTAHSPEGECAITNVKQNYIL